LLADAPFLGNDLLVWLLLALGAAMVVGNGLALLRPPPAPKKGELRQAPRGRSMVMIAIGLVAAIAALGALLAKK
jgi:hypothetical protein